MLESPGAVARSFHYPLGIHTVYIANDFLSRLEQSVWLSYIRYLLQDGIHSRPFDSYPTILCSSLYLYGKIHEQGDHNLPLFVHVYVYQVGASSNATDSTSLATSRASP
jgi:hypothetical protein